MVETSPSNAGGMGSLPGQAAKILYASGPENQTEATLKQIQQDFKNAPGAPLIFSGPYPSGF